MTRGAFARFPHAVARDPRVTPELLVVLAYRATFAGEYRLYPAKLRRIVSTGLGRDVVRRAFALGDELGYLRRHQEPGQPGKFGKLRERLCLPKCGESGRAGQMVWRAWFDGTLSLKELAGLLYVRAGTGKGKRAYTRELRERSAPTSSRWSRWR